MMQWARWACLGLLLAPAWALAQDRWPTMPGFREYREAQSARGAIRTFTMNMRWTDASTLTYRVGAESRTWNAKSRSVVAGGSAPHMEALVAQWSGRPFAWPQVERGRQEATARAADGTVATYRNGNLFLTEGGREVKITPDGDLTKRLKYGIASWVYGEELEQKDAFGFSPDSRFLWLYRFDESKVPDYFLAMNQGGTRSTLDVEAYPKPGDPNPEVDLLVYDRQTNKLNKVPVRSGTFDDGLGHYVYAITWAQEGPELYFHRMDRKQQIRELVAYHPVTQALRVVDRETNLKAWVEYGMIADRLRQGNRLRPMPPKILFLSEADGAFNVVELDTQAGKRRRLTNFSASSGAEVLVIGRETPTEVWVTASDGATPYRHQLHLVNRVTGESRRLTDPAFHHLVSISPDAQLIAVESQTSASSPHLRVLDRTGKVVADLGRQNISALASAGFLPSEKFAIDTPEGHKVYARIHFPRTFDPKRKYPVMFDVYGGPLPIGWGVPGETFGASSAEASTGFLWVEVWPRGGHGRGSAFRQALYQKMGIVEIDDIAAVARGLAARPYVDSQRVAIHGTSYGGYAAAMAILRYPDLFQGAVASSMVSDWRQYDTTYTERFMGLLPESKAAYDAGSTLTYARNLRGWLMLYFGTADNNTHPSNTFSLSQALTRAGKYHELQVGVDAGHTGLRFDRMMEFIVERLVMNPPRTSP